MNNPETEEILSEIQTIWSVVDRAHHDTGEPARRALHDLIQRYRGAIYRYLRRAVRDPDAAEELAQEFSLRILRGDFRQADPRRGRFRDYLKTALFHLVIDYQRRQRSHPGPLPPD